MVILYAQPYRCHRVVVDLLDLGCGVPRYVYVAACGAELVDVVDVVLVYRPITAELYLNSFDKLYNNTESFVGFFSSMNCNISSSPGFATFLTHLCRIETRYLQNLCFSGIRKEKLTI